MCGPEAETTLVPGCSAVAHCVLCPSPLPAFLSEAFQFYSTLCHNVTTSHPFPLLSVLSPLQADFGYIFMNSIFLFWF